MRILIWTEAGVHVGMGHLERCLAICAELRSLGATIKFATSSEMVVERSLSEGFGKPLLLDYCAGEMEKIAELRRMALPFKPDALLVDSYEVHPQGLRLLNGDCRTVYIDDLQQEVFSVAAVVNGNLSANPDWYYAQYGEEAVELFLGAAYCPLRREFFALPSPAIKTEIENVFVSTGGSDPYDASVSVCRALLEVSAIKGATIHMMAGLLNANIPILRKMALQNKRLVVHIGTRDVAGLMRSCDMAVSAAGTTLDELCACGVPSLTFSLADNQINGAKCFAREGASINLGHIKDGRFSEALKENAGSLAASEKVRRSLSMRAQELFDGRGARRVAEIVMGKKGLLE